MNFFIADERNPIMGLDNKNCRYPKYWCRLHQVWLSEEDVIKKQCRHKPSLDLHHYNICSDLEENNPRLEKVQQLAAEFRARRIENKSNLKMHQQSIRGIPLKSKYCNGYGFYSWDFSDDKPDYDTLKAQYCYISVKLHNVEYKFQVIIDHEAKMVYLPTEYIRDDYAQEAERIILQITSEAQ